jgi:hypothetical protein
MHGETDQFGSKAQNRRVSISVAPGRPAPAPTLSGAAISQWPDGPTVARKQKATPLDQYVAWVREVEAAYGDREDVIHRLRRLYYSSLSGTAGPKFDQLIAGQDDPPPLTSPPLSLTALNGLYETDSVETTAGESLDPAHILPALDLALQGASPVGTGIEYVSDAPLTGVFTWTGDLASWFHDWIDQKRERPGLLDVPLLLSRVNSKVSRDDLLSDMDAQIMVASEITTTIEARSHAGNTYFEADATLNRPLSEILQSYYGAAQGTPQPNRFARFVKVARPSIPYETPDPAKPLELKLALDAELKIYHAIYATEEAFLERDDIAARVGTPHDLRDNSHLVREIARRFRIFLEKGLETGSAPWP